MMNSPVVLFTYNRPHHTKKVLEALQKNEMAEKSVLIIYQDGPKKDLSKSDLSDWKKVNELIKNVTGFKEVIIRISEINLGCDPSMIKGISEVVNEYGKIIVLEDDLVVSSHFLTYMNTGLELFQDIEEVGAINGYSYQFEEDVPDYFFMRGVNPYGWATWGKYWELYTPNSLDLVTEIENRKLIKEYDFGYTFDILKNTTRPDSKGGRDAIWYASLFVNNVLGLFPSQSYVHNIGFDETGTHTNKIKDEVRQSQWPIKELNECFLENDLKNLVIMEDHKTKRIIQRKYDELAGKFTGKKKLISEYYRLKHFIKTRILRWS